MDRLLGVSTEGEWEAWIKFCWEAVIAQSRDAERRCDKFLKLHRDFRNRIREGSHRSSKLVDTLFSRPVMTVNQYRAMAGISYPPAREDMRKLDSMGMITPLEEIPQITYDCVLR